MTDHKKQLSAFVQSRKGLAVAAAIFGGLPAYSAEVQSAREDASVWVVSQQQRLSAWLTTQPPSTALSDGEPNILSWLAASQKAGQLAHRNELVQALKGGFSPLASLLASMPVTGRVPLRKTDGRWLEANPAADPMLQPGDSLVRVPRRGVVTVLKSTGHLCQVPHQTGLLLRSYLAACGVRSPAWAWVMEPDGAVLEQGVAPWNESAQVPAAPGAWIWAPDGDDQMPVEVARKVAKFVSTQVDVPFTYPWRYVRKPAEDAVQQDAAGPAPRGLFVGSNSWGGVGLMQTPSARMEAVGTGSLMYNRTVPYAVLKARLQAADWLSVGFGYVSISDRMYGAASFSGDQSYKDKSLDVKLRVWPESAWMPELAVGLRDLIGTGLFASEYLVASKRFGDLDVSGGLAFGYMAGRQDADNPLGVVSERFKTRPREGSHMGGGFNAGSYFRGPVSVFGGVQFQLPSDKWQFKLEYEGNDYQHEPAGSPIRATSSFNVGVVYRWAPWLDLTLGLERGNRAMFTVSTHARLDTLHTPKVLDPRRVPVLDAYPPVAAPVSQTAKDIEAQTDVPVQSIVTDGLRMSVTLSNPDVAYVRSLVDKVAAVAHRDAPSQVERISVKIVQQGVPMAEVEVDRARWVRERTQYLANKDAEPVVRAVRPGPQEASSAPSWPSGRSRELDYGVSLSYRQNLGGPDGFLMFQLAGDLGVEWRPGSGTWLAGTVRLGLIDNYSNFKYTAPSDLPRVRTYIREYLVTERLTVPLLQISRLGSMGSDHFYLAYAGLLESMFGGVGAEYLYRPLNSRLAFGVDVNHVQQRDFAQRLAMRDYKVDTGHVTAYWDTGVSDVLLKLSVGRYLAGDLGGTVDASRVFGNGVAIGAFATKTNVSADRFGEGSFDKGIYVSIPFDAMLPRSGSGVAHIVYHPLLRDGGARLYRRYTLFDLTKARDPRMLEFRNGAPY